MTTINDPSLGQGPHRESIDVVLFDVGGTLLRVRPSVGAVYASTAQKYGVVADPSQLQRNFGRAWRLSHERRRARDFVCCDELLREEWFRVVCDTFGAAIPESEMRPLFNDLYDSFATAEAWEVAPGARENLAYLRSRGVRLGVLSNWDSRLHTTLDEVGLSGAFDFFIVSYQVGVEKPHPEIFAAALAAGGRGADQTLLIGDSYEADIEPARALGLATLWVSKEADRRAQPEAGPGFDVFPNTPDSFWSCWLTP